MRRVPLPPAPLFARPGEAAAPPAPPPPPPPPPARRSPAAPPRARAGGRTHAARPASPLARGGGVPAPRPARRDAAGARGAGAGGASAFGNGLKVVGAEWRKTKNNRKTTRRTASQM